MRDKILLVMVPGEWHSTGDLLRAAGLSDDGPYTSKFYQELWPAGYVRRAQNPEWAPADKWSTRDRPRYLWTLTEAGEKERAAIEAIVTQKETPPG